MFVQPTDSRRKVFTHYLNRLPTVLGYALVLVLVAFSPSQAQTYSIFYTFPTERSGDRPQGVIEDAAGNLYGVTYYGGTHGDGAIFKLDKSGNETVLHSFNGSDGNAPVGVVRDSAGNLYGATSFGGVGCSGDGGCGTVFKLDKNGKETVLHRFGARRGDGRFPQSNLIRDAAGNLYGTTYNGGVLTCNSGGWGCGTIYKIDPSGNETVLYRFRGTSDGAGPNGVIQDEAGNLYGTSGTTVFKLDASGNFTVLYTFTGGTGGGTPFSGVIRDAEGNLYGTTIFGGDFGFGTVYKLDPAGNETVLYSFTGGADGSLPYAGVVRDATGNFYGTAAFGGEVNCVGSNDGCGVAFKLDPTGNETVLHTFTSGKDGLWPYWGATLDAKGNLYGVTATGGDCCGTVFKIAP